jgi:transposase
VRALDRRIAQLDRRIAVEVGASGTTLTKIFGVGPILAAKILGMVGDVLRFPSKSHFASYAGVAPIETSSGEVVGHRLSLVGDRRLNQIMHMIAVCQLAAIPCAAGRTIVRSWRRARSRAGRRCAASSEASRMLCTGVRRRFGARFSRIGLTQRGLEVWNSRKFAPYSGNSKPPKRCAT